MAEIEVEGVDASSDPPSPIRQSTDDVADMVVEIPQKRRGKQRLLRGLQRISSSPALAQFGRARASSAPYRGPGSLSCVSLASGSSPFYYQPSHGSSFAQTSTGPFVTSPISGLGSPLAEPGAYPGMESILP